MTTSLSRRTLLGLLGTSALAAGAGSIGVARSVAGVDDVVPFYGAHQTGVATAPQQHLLFSAFDVTTDDRAQLVGLLQRWTALAADLMQGTSMLSTFDGEPTAPPDDNGESALLSTARLTVTVGFGPSLFDAVSLTGRRPAPLVPVPPLPLDDLDPQRSDGDLGVQVCADDPLVAMHAMRVLKRAAIGTCIQRWSQSGFISPPRDGSTPRNLFGFKDGTANAADSASLNAHVWATDDWMAGGTYLVARRIAMTIEVWDRTSLVEQEQIVGRRKGDGAPLSGGDEFTEPDLAATIDTGTAALPSESTVERVISDVAHIRLAHPSRNEGRRMLRRGYNYQDGVDALGRWDAGLFFLAYSRDPRTHVVPPMIELARHDVMNEYIRHTSTAVYAVPPGVRDERDWFGRTLFES